MNAPVAITATETQQIEAALDALLREALAADRHPRLVPPRGAETLGAILGEFIHRKRNWTAAQEATAELLERPIWELTRQGVTTLGVRLHEIGGLKLMQEVCERVADMDPANWGRRTDIMDKRWDGIGADSPDGGWWA